MDDPNLMPISSNSSSEKQDTMTSVSPPKRTIVLGVVNTAGMKSTNMNRKRRWDQPPEEMNETPMVKKMCLEEEETSPVKENESPEAATAILSDSEKINFPCEIETSQSTFPCENEEKSEGSLQSHSSHLSSEASAMSVDCPEDSSDRLIPSPEQSSNVISCSENIGDFSEVNVLESCNEVLNSDSPDSRFLVDDNKPQLESSCDSICETSNAKSEQVSSTSATVISHKSDELRRIMFSYDEGSSDSDNTENINCNEEFPVKSNSASKTEGFRVNVPAEEPTEAPKNILMNTSEEKNMFETVIEFPPSAVTPGKTVLGENNLKDDLAPQYIDNTNEPTNNQGESDYKEVTAFGENDHTGVEANLIESQPNIPNKIKFIEISEDNVDVKDKATCSSMKRDNQGNECLLPSSKSSHDVTIDHVTASKYSGESSISIKSQSEYGPNVEGMANNFKNKPAGENKITNILGSVEIEAKNEVDADGSPIVLSNDIKGAISHINLPPVIVNDVIGKLKPEFVNEMETNEDISGQEEQSTLELQKKSYGTICLNEESGGSESPRKISVIETEGEFSARRDNDYLKESKLSSSKTFCLKDLDSHDKSLSVMKNIDEESLKESEDRGNLEITTSVQGKSDDFIESSESALVEEQLSNNPNESLTESKNILTSVIIKDNEMGTHDGVLSDDVGVISDLTKEITESIPIEENSLITDAEIESSMNVKPSNSIDPDIVEVILGSNKGLSGSFPQKTSKSVFKNEVMKDDIESKENMSATGNKDSHSALKEITKECDYSQVKFDAAHIEKNVNAVSDIERKIIRDVSSEGAENKDEHYNVTCAETGEINLGDNFVVERKMEVDNKSIENEICIIESIESDDCVKETLETKVIDALNLAKGGKLDINLEKSGVLGKLKEPNNVTHSEMNPNVIKVSELGINSEIEIVKGVNEDLKCTETNSVSEGVCLGMDSGSVNNSEIELSTGITIETEVSSVEKNETSFSSTEMILTESGTNTLKRKDDIELCSGDSNDLIESNDVELDNVEETEVIVEESDSGKIIDYEKGTSAGNNGEDLSKINDQAKIIVNESSSTKITMGDKFSSLSDENELLAENSRKSTVPAEIVIESSSLDYVYDNTILDATDVGLEVTSVDSNSYESALNSSPDDSKDFVEVMAASDDILTEEATPDKLFDQISGESLSHHLVKNKVVTTEKVVSSVEMSSEVSLIAENILQDDSKTSTDVIESFVVEEVVTCDSRDSEKGEDIELDCAIDDMPSSAILDVNCDETESLVVSDDINVVINRKIVDSEDLIDDKNGVFDKSNVDTKNSNKTDFEKIVNDHNEFETDLKNEPFVNSIEANSPFSIGCGTAMINMNKTGSSFEEEGMDVDEVTPLNITDSKLKTEYMEVERASSVGDPSSTIKDVSDNIPLLKTVTNSVFLRKEKPPTPVDEIDRSGNISGLDPKLEPITLRIYKDTLSVKTDDLDSPKKNKSPKLSSELKSQLSPHIKSSENRSSLSPTTKKLEFTLKIAKDINTNIPRATMSPKHSLSPGSIHKPGDILRAELTSESGRSSPAYSENKVKLKISKPSPSSLSKEFSLSQVQGIIPKEESIKVKEEDLNQSSGLSLPKPPIEIGNVFRKMMETEKRIDSVNEISSMNQSMDPSTIITPVTPVVKKRGRPRKILQKILTPGDNGSGLNSNLSSSLDSGTPLNHSLGSPSMLDVSSGMDGSDQSSRQVRSCRARTKPIVVKTRKPRGGGVGRGGMRGGRGGISGLVRQLAADKDPEKLAEKLSEREKAELAKIEERREKQRLERIAKNEAKKAKKLARKLKDEERRLKRLREKAEKAEAAAPQVFEEETRMSAADGGSRGHTPAPPSALSRLNQTGELEESQNSFSTPTSSQIKRGRMEIPIDPESKEVRVDQLAEYQWQGSELFMIQEQVSSYLGVKSFKRKYPDLKRRPVEAEERTFLEDSGLVPKSMCDLGLTAVSSAEVLDIMFQDFPDKYEEFRKYVREKQAREASFKQKAVFANLKHDKSKGEPRDQALEAVAMWNSNLNRERREDRRCALDLQTFTVHYPKQVRDKMLSRSTPKTGVYPVSLIPGQFSDYYKEYTPTELMYFPLNTVMYGPLKPNERQPINPSDGSGSDCSSSSTSEDSSGSSSSDSESEGEESASRECKICNGEKKTNKESHPEILLQCSNCKGLCHPTCQEITPEMLPHIKKYNWHCSNCKKCMQCKNSSKDDKMLFCDLCDRGYHIHCVGLRKAPEGRWHCSVCSFCTVCGSKDPGGPEWNYEYKKTDKGVRLYQRTLCVSCNKNALM